jgi:putative ABC transport system permease protein
LEAFALAAAGAVVGAIAGALAALTIGELNFHTVVGLHPAVWLVTLAVNLVVAAIAAMLPLRALRGIQPAALLRGE